jgi:hypothetical protein
MSSKTQDSFSIETLSAYSQPANGNSGYCPAASAVKPPVNRVLVPRRLSDDVQLSRESSANDEAAASSLCSNFMAAWG